MWASAPTGGTAFLTEGREAVKGVKTPADAGKADVKAAEAVHQDFNSADNSQKAADKKAPAQKENLPELKFTDAEIQSIQNIGRKSVNSFNARDTAATEKLAQRYWEELGEKSPFYRAKNGDWRETEQTAVQIATKPDATRGVQKNTDTGWDIQVSGKVFAESQHLAKKNTAAIPYLPYISDIVKNAVLLDSCGVDQGKAKSHNTLLMHSMYAVADIGKGPEVLKLYVEEMNDPNKTTTAKRAYQLQNIEKAPAVSGGVQGKTPSSLANTANAIHTVADLYAAVKSKDGAFQPQAAEKPTNRKVGWDGRVVAKEATGQSVTVDGKKYEFLGYDEKGSPVYQDAEVLREQRTQVETNHNQDSKDVQTQEDSKESVANREQYDKIVSEIKAVGGFAENARIHIPPLDVMSEGLAFDDTHINGERGHNVSREMAETWIKESMASVTVWNGRFERYYGANGVVYVDRLNNNIRTAYSVSEYDETTRRILEVLEKHGD